MNTRAAWLAHAAGFDVEHIFALDDDDPDTIAATSGFQRVVSPALGGAVTAVRNWNAAARVATGELLFVIADDLTPVGPWAARLTQLVAGLDPTATAFGIKVAEIERPSDSVMRHPIVSRAFYHRFGLFDPRFRGLCCDNELQTRAFWKAFIIDGDVIAVRHDHPQTDATTDPSANESQRRLNAHDEWDAGLRLYASAWPRRKRQAPTFFVPPRICAGRRPGHSRQLALGTTAAVVVALRLSASLLYFVRQARPALGKMLRAAGLLRRPPRIG